MLVSVRFIRLVLIGVLIVWQAAHAEDFFSDNLARDFKYGVILTGDTTTGGYSIYQGGQHWDVISGKTSSNNMNLKLGYIQLISPIGNKYFAEMFLMANLQQGNSYYTGEPCNGEHLVKSNKGGGRFDNCMTIDPYISIIRGKDITTLSIRIRNSQQGARVYDMKLLLNLDQLGFPQTELHDWTKDNIARDRAKKQLIEKVTDWANELQDGVNKAIDYSKPKDAFKNVPSLSYLLPVIGETVTGQEAKSEQSTTPAVAATKTLMQRLSELKELLDKGLITQEQYEKKSTEIIKNF